MLEVGPGLGILTQTLARAARRVVAFELDRDLAAALPRMVPENVQIVQGDALTLDPGEYLTGPYKLVANLPYQITSPFLFRYLDVSPAPSVMVVMVQREVAERIVQPVGSLSYLAVAVQSVARPRIVRQVPPWCFHPRPKIDRRSSSWSRSPSRWCRSSGAGLPGSGQSWVGQPRKQLLNSFEQGFATVRWPMPGLTPPAARSGQHRQRAPPTGTNPRRVADGVRGVRGDGA